MKLMPKQKKATKIVLSSVASLTDVSLILYGGAIRGGKTYWGLITFLMLCEIYPGSRWTVVRKDLSRIRDNTIPSFNKLLNENPFLGGKLKQSPYIYTHPNGSKILFRGENIDKDPYLDKYKGYETNGFLFEEMNEITEQMLFKGFERAGSWIISNLDEQPRPIILGTCNPTQGWVKHKIYTPWKDQKLQDKWIYIPAKISDNTELPKSYKESLKNLPRYEYEVYVEGNWDVQLKTGGEFLKYFELQSHVSTSDYDPEKTIHVSIDSNVKPYIAMSLWQLHKVGEAWKAIKFAEIPAEYPHNSANKAARLLVRELKKLGYSQPVYLYGDATTKAKNNIDDDNRSFLELFKIPISNEYSIRERFFTKNPAVAATGEFMNTIFEDKIENISIKISEVCKKTISDYIEVKEDKDGGMLKKKIKDTKTGASYEPYGHFLDTDRYFICKAFEYEFSTFRQRLSNYSDKNVPEAKESFLNGGF